ncbi:acyltransferase [Flavobacterium sp.]|uniref:acyltransferase family protein n=1 Tax=Flavobacterium sp. TaxID=239 RepID=UPI0025C38B24|nr:acyltransferase [Flavobacterium sp.]
MIDRIANQENNFNFIRVVAAIMVIITHTYVLVGLDVKHDFLYKISNGEIMISTAGLRMFFIISGFLITQSMERSKDYMTFFVKRVLRIFPGLIVCVLSIIFIFGACFTNVPLHDYFSRSTTWEYLWNMTVYRVVGTIPTVFENNIAHIIDGSLWTLAYEFSYYIMVMALCAVGIFKRKWLGIVLFVLFFSIRLYTLYAEVPPKIFYFLIHTHLQLDHFSDFGLFFIAGMLLYLYKDRITYKHSVAIVLLLLYVVSIYANVAWVMKYITIAYVTMYLAFVPKVNVIRKWGQKTDYSYGIYIYGMPVQQTVIACVGIHLAPDLISIISVILVIPIAWLSWNLIEKRALSLNLKRI